MTAMIKGAKGGSKKQRAPREAPDSLVSIAYARLIDLVSEGEIEGLVNGEASIYLDETPAGSGAFPGFRWEQRTGTQDQTYLAGFPQVENEISLGVELRSDSPWVRSVTNLDLSAVRINFSLPRLAQQNTSNGDTNGYRVEYAIDVAEGAGPFEEVLRGAFDGKTAGGYERSVRVDLEGRPAGGWRVRVRRLTANSDSSAISDTTNIKSITEIVDAKFRYPNSALVGVSFDAETFGGSVPRRGYHMRGRILRVPSNYDHATRTYTGVWDGTFKLSYSNNPAWVYYDLLLHPRYGLGDRVDATQVDKWSLYQIAQYCDQLVPDGMGGMEPRFTCNLYLQKRADAYKALQDIAAIFRGITYWGAGQAVVSADMPADPVYTYTNANVIGGKFSYKGSKRSTRYSAALVSWNDPADMYRAKVEYVQDDEAVARFGVQTTEIMALGCTSQGQAQRAGKWALLTNLLETETVTFSVGLDGIRARPGQIIRVADNDRAGRRIGGRVSAATRSAITVDKVEGVEVGDELTCILPDGNAQTRTITGVDGNQIAVSPQFDAAPVGHSVWAWESPTLAAQRYRVVTISESGPLEYAITASKYVEGKHQAVDTGAIISQRPITSIPSSVQAAPENIRAISSTMIEQTMAVTTMTTIWDAAEGATRYDVEWRRNEDAWVYAGRTGGTEMDVVGIYAGTYQIRVRAMNSLDVASPWAYSDSMELDGKQGVPPAPAYLNTTSIIFGIDLRWGFPVGAEDTLRTQIEYNTSPSEQNALHLGDFAYPLDTHTMTGLKAAQVFYFRARLVDRTGNVGPWSDWVMGQSSADADEILDYIAGQISETELAEQLREEIEKISGNGPGSVNDRIDGVSGELGDIAGDVADLQDGVAGLNSDLQSSVSNLNDAIEDADTRLTGRIENVASDISGLGNSISDLYDQVGGLDDDLQSSVSDLNSQLAQLETQLADITGAEDWAPGQAYLAGTLVRFDGALYRAEQDVPAGTPVSDAAYWRKVGDYASIGEAVAALAIQVTDMQLQVDEIGGTQSSIIETTNALIASSRGNRADGDKADALRGWQTQASITQRDRVEASDKAALAERLLAIDAQIGDASAQLSTLQQAFADETTATASALASLSSSLGSTAAGLQQEIQTRATETTALASDIQALQVALEDVATVEAFQGLVAEVEQLGEDISAVGQSVTTLAARIGDAESAIADKADASALQALTIEVSQIGEDLSSAAQSIVSLGATLTTVSGVADAAADLAAQADGKADEALQEVATKADASAVQGLTAEVQQIGEDVAANSGLITELGSSVTAAQQAADEALAGLTDKADASALQALTTEVDQIGEDVAANSGAITALDSRVESAETGIAGNAAAVESLATDVSAIDGRVTAAAEQASRLSAELRPSRADGDKADSLRGWQTQASIVESSRVSASEREVLAQRLFSAEVQLGEASAQISVLEAAFSDESQATASQLTALASELGTTASSLQQEIQTRATETAALAQDVQSMQAALEDVATSEALAALRAEVEEVDGRVTSSAEDIVALTNALANKADAGALNALSNTVTQQGNTITSQGQALTALNGRVEDAETGISGNADAIETMGQEVQLLDGKVTATADQASRIAASIRPARADGDKADALRGYQSQASIAESRRVTATEAESSAERDLLLQAGLAQANAALLQEQQTRATADTALAEQAVSLRAQIDGVSATVGQVDAASVSRDQALGQRTATVEARMPAGTDALATSGAVQQVQQAVANESAARAQDISTVQAAVGTAQNTANQASAAVQVVSDAVADLEGGVSTMWSVRMQVNQAGQYVYAGIGLGIENGPGGLQSQFLVEANRFALLNTLNGVTTTPFVVEGGQVFMNSAVIKQADIVNLIVTGVLQSPDYEPGQSGIRINFVTGEFEMNSTVPGQGRTVITNRATKVYDGNNMLRVQMGDLTI